MKKYIFALIFALIALICISNVSASPDITAKDVKGNEELSKFVAEIDKIENKTGRNLIEDDLGYVYYNLIETSDGPIHSMSDWKYHSIDDSGNDDIDHQFFKNNTANPNEGGVIHWLNRT